ncbi:holin [Bacteroides phage EMB2]|nr:holin [Bacteroides phage EMB2]
MYSIEYPYRVNQVIEQLETYFRTFFAVTVLTVVTDIRDFIFLVVIVTALNWLAGYLADHRKGKPYQHKKTMQAVKELFLTSAILFFVALTCNMLEPGIDYRLLIKGLTGIFLIIYARNITKNLCIIQPSNEFIKVLNSIANSKYFSLKKKIKDGEFEIPLEEKEKEDGEQQ